MALTHESILSLLIREGGKIKKSDLVSKFKGSLECDDPADKERNREAFKTLVNSVAFVKEIDSVRYVVVKKTYHHLLEGAEQTDRGEGAQRGDDPGADRSADQKPDQKTESISPLQLALQRSKVTDGVKRRLNVEIQSQGANGATPGEAAEPPGGVRSKPYALPLRMPPARVEFRKLKEEPNDRPESPTPNASRNERPPSTEGEGPCRPPQPGRALKSPKAPDESRETRAPSLVPLERSEHEWLVRCAAGHWSQAYGLLLRDSQLAEKKDFMSGFTALHWAVKSGNSKMLVNMVAVAKQGGVDLEMNAKTHGGYTPLHIAALHNQEYIMALLVEEYGADPGIRDNCGRRAYHYLHKGISGAVRKLLGEPGAQQTRDRAPHGHEELDPGPDLSKGRHSIGRLFQPQAAGSRKKQKQRPGSLSMNGDAAEEREYVSSSSYRPRILSEVFM
ncbi:ankyrin repeat domain-containing protein SOWAHA [Brachionichthys hirsutus]|uniref:ankyrin repeat domain-containing protein SOWAHA n=1 Tax=Brachionichthys hirsutus TaxID=412623 RepID=UPI00360518C4